MLTHGFVFHYGLCVCVYFCFSTLGLFANQFEMPVHEQFTSGATGPRENEPELSQTSQVQGTARVVREDGAKKKKGKKQFVHEEMWRNVSSGETSFV